MKELIIYLIAFWALAAFEIYMFKTTKDTKRIGWIVGAIGTIFAACFITFLIIVSLTGK